MLLFSLSLRTSNIADISDFGVERIQILAEECSFLPIDKEDAYLLKPKHIEACEHKTFKNNSQKSTYEIDERRQEKKLNSGKNTHLITFLN